MQNLQPRARLRDLFASHAAKDSALCGNLHSEVCSDWALHRTCFLDVARDLGNQVFLVGERSFVAQAPPELHDQPFSVEIALEIEQESLDAALAAAIVRVRADRNRGAVAGRPARVDPVRGHEQVGVDAEVGGRIAECAAAGIAGNIYQESKGNPESVGSGGGGLIGWTPLPSGFVTGNVQADLQAWGLKQTSIEDNTTTARDAALVLARLERRELLPEAETSELLDMLRHTVWTDRLQSGVPSWLPVAHKIGTDVQVYNDAALFLDPQHPYIAVVLSSGDEESDALATMTRVSQLVYQFEAGLPAVTR